VKRESAIEQEKLRRLQVILLTREAQITPHSQWSLFSHLADIARILEQWEEPFELVLAAFVSATYHKSAATSAPSLSERGFMRDVVGAKAERLAYLRSLLTPYQIDAFLDQKHPRESSYSFRDDVQSDHHVLTAIEVRHLVVLSIATLAAETSNRDGAPSRWLNEASRRATFLQTFERAPAIFSGCTGRVSSEIENTLLSAYEQGWLKHSAEASSALRDAIGSCPWVAEPSILLGLLQLMDGDAIGASQSGTRGVEICLEWNCSWDKRLSPERWLSLALFLEDANRLTEAEVKFLNGRLHDIISDEKAVPGVLIARLEAVRALKTEDARFNALQLRSEELEFNFLPDRFAEYVHGLKFNVASPQMLKYPHLTSQASWPSDKFELVKVLEQNADRIAEEFHRVPRSDFSPNDAALERSGSISVFYLYERGRRRDRHCALIPLTTHTIEANDRMQTIDGQAFFLKLAPGSFVAPNIGLENTRLRCVLPISIPLDCGLKVNGVDRILRLGQCDIFDDSFTHEFWNWSEQDQVVFMVDLWHPELVGEEIEYLMGWDRHIRYNIKKFSKS